MWEREKLVLSSKIIIQMNTKLIKIDPNFTPKSLQIHPEIDQNQPKFQPKIPTPKFRKIAPKSPQGHPKINAKFHPRINPKIPPKSTSVLTPKSRKITPKSPQN